MKIKEILEYGKNNLIQKGQEGYRLTKSILKHLLNVTDSYILINNEEEIKEEIINEFKKDIELLKSGTPLQYITNKQEFMGMNFYVDSNVLIPQPDTEILVEEVISLCKQHSKVLDLCTGSGAIGISIVKNTESVDVTMSDISEKALEIAKKNASNNEVIDDCNFVLSDMFKNIQDKFDVIVSNPPYIKTEIIKTLDKEVRNEPHLALDGGKDGLNFYKVISQNAYKHLNKNGILALEIGYDQREEVINLLQIEGKYIDIYCKKDLAGNDRIIVCKLK